MVHAGHAEFGPEHHVTPVSAIAAVGTGKLLGIQRGKSNDAVTSSTANELMEK